MRRSDRIYGAIGGLAAVFGVVAALTGRLTLGLPFIIIGLMLFWSVWANRNWK